MRLPGNLRSTTLGDLLGRLYREGCSGTLELVEDRGQFSGRRHRIHLNAGLVEGVDTELPVARLGEILVAEGLVSEKTVRHALLQALDDGRRAPFGQALVNRRALTREVLVAALRYQVRRRLDSLFSLKEALVRFRVPRPRRGSERPIPLSPREFLFGRPRLRTRQRRVGQAEHGPRQEPRPSKLSTRRLQALRDLGLPAAASDAEIRQAFRRLARQNHPDRFPGAGAEHKRELLQRFAELSTAYHVLMS